MPPYTFFSRLMRAEGLGCRRDFSLPQEDSIWLESLHLRYDLVAEGGVLRVVIHDYALPSGYNLSTVAVSVRVDPGYPDTQIDMVYFLPDIGRQDGRPIASICTEGFGGQPWQRWSRHRTPANPWRPGIDNLSTHFALIDHWLARELLRA
jgi:Prokaryotic E2 family E